MKNLLLFLLSILATKECSKIDFYNFKSILDEKREYFQLEPNSPYSLECPIEQKNATTFIIYI